MKEFPAAERPPRSPYLRYGLAVLAPLAAIPAAILLTPYVHPNSFQVFLAAVMASGLYGGFRPGLLTTALSCLFLARFVQPQHSLSIEPASLPAFALFFTLGFFVSLLCEARIRAIDRSEQLLAGEQTLRRDAEKERERSRSILESIGDGFVAMDRDGCFTYVNQRAADLARRNKDELVGRRMADIFPDLMQSVVWLDFQDAVANGRAFRFEHYHAPYSTWFEIDAYPSQDGISFFGRDVTARKRAEQRLTLLHGVAHAVSESSSVEEACTTMIRDICRGLSWDSGNLWSVDREAGVLRCVAFWDNPDVPIPQFREMSHSIALPPGVGLPGRAWVRREPFWVPDFTAEPGPRAAVAARERLHAALALPLLSGGRVIGVMEFFSPDTREPDQGLLDLMGALGAQIGQFVERKRVEVEVRESEARKRAILESAMDCIITMDHDGRIQEFNPAAERIFGYTRDEAIGASLGDLIIPPGLRESHRLGLEHYLRTGVGPVLGRRTEVTAMRKDRSELPVELAVMRIPSDGPPMFTAYLRDITERKRSEEALATQARELERSNRDLEQFAYVASHDLQEPLRMVASYTQLLAKRYVGRLDSDADEFIGYAIGGVGRMQQLINDLLAYSRVGRRAKELVPVECGAVLQIALDNLRVAIAESGAVVSHGPLPAIQADETQLIQLFQNLVGNALKFRREDPPRIAIAAEADEGGWLFSVRDNGLGMDPKHLERIFVLFQRLHGRSEYPGTGIGLALCKKIVEGHGGRIWAESEPGRGSVFFFKLPPAPPSPRDATPGSALQTSFTKSA